MTSITMEGQARSAVAPRLTQGRVMHSEWIKLRSLKSTIWTLAASSIVIVAAGILLCLVARKNVDAGRHLGTSTGTLSMYGAYFAPLTIGVLGVLMITGEYSTGMIRATLSAVPHRLPVLWAKLAVLTLAVGLITELTLLATFLAGQAILAGTGAGVSLGDPGMLRVVLGTGLYVTCVCLLGTALGFVIRSTAGALSTVFGLMLVLPILVNVLPTSLGNHIAPYLPSNAGQAILAVHRVPGMLAPWTGLAVFAGYLAVVVAAGAICLTGRDA